jgi:ubiquinone/menaquinone biosynthesis C-methylase UbiE
MADTTPGPAPTKEDGPRHHRICPWWMGYLLTSPLRRLGENPETILAPYVTPGMTVVDIGCAMGFFSLPLARMVGDHGRVVCVDLQQRMLSTLGRRARRRGLDRIVETRLCSQERLGLDDLAGRAGLVLAAHVVHESTFPERFLEGCRTTLQPGGRLVILEPAGHVTAEEFGATRELALASGLVEHRRGDLRRSRMLVLERRQV